MKKIRTSIMIVGFWGQKRRLFGAYIKFKVSIAYMQLVGPFADERYWHISSHAKYFPKVVFDPFLMILYIPSNNLKSLTALHSSLWDRLLHFGRASLG